MDHLTSETMASLLRASGAAVVCTRGGRVEFVTPVAERILGGDCAGQSAAGVLPERLLKLQGSLGAASWRCRGRDCVVTLCGAGLYKFFYLHLTPPPRRMPPLPLPEWTELANLRMAAEHLKNAVKDASETDRLHAARLMKSYYRLHRWFSNVSTFSALQEGTLPFQPAAADCAAFLRRLTDQLTPLAESKGIRVIAEIPEQPTTLMMDEALMERAIMNLLLNSLLHCSSGSRVRLGLASGSDSVTFTVQDTGSGIAREAMGSLFTAYDRVPELNPDHAGCGLPVALGIARLHAGDILLESTPGTGTAVLITLPRNTPEHISLQAGKPEYDHRDLTWFYSGMADFLDETDLL